MEYRTLKWCPTLKNGQLGPETDVVVSGDDYEYLHDLYRRIDRTPKGPDRTALINELRTHMDIRAYFPGASFTDLEEPPEDDGGLPVYLLDNAPADEPPDPSQEPQDDQLELL